MTIDGAITTAMPADVAAAVRVLPPAMQRGALDAAKEEFAEEAGGPTFSLVTADAILTAVFPEVAFVVPELLPVGLTILAGRPKVGKSWLALQVAYSVTAGGMVLGHKVEAGRVLYFALEDNQRRLQKRMKAQGWRPGLPCQFMTMQDFRNEIGDLIKGYKKLTGLIKDGGFRLTVIDTLGRALPGDPSDPEMQTRALDPLQSFAAEADCAILCIDHHRKSNGLEADAVADILGATQKAAIADAIWGLYKQHGKVGAKLGITGRDLEELTLALTFDHATRCWQSEGDANVLDLTQRRSEIIALLRGLGRAQANEIAKNLGQDRSNVYRRLQDMVNAGMVRREEDKGKFWFSVCEDPEDGD